MELGFAVNTDTKLFRIGFRSESFQWVPGEEESGKSYPAQYFDSPRGDQYVMWSWLWFVIFYARAL